MKRKCKSSRQLKSFLSVYHITTPWTKHRQIIQLTIRPSKSQSHHVELLQFLWKLMLPTFIMLIGFVSSASLIIWNHSNRKISLIWSKCRMQRSMKEKTENDLYHHRVLCVRACVCVCDWVSSSKLLPVDLQSYCINYELYQIRNGGEVQGRLLLHRWRGWIWNTSMWIYWHTHSSSSRLSSTSSSSSSSTSSSSSLHSWALTKYQRHKEKVLTRQKFLIPFISWKKAKQSSEEISIPTLIPALVNFRCRQPLRPVKSDVTPGEGERNIQIIFQIFFQRCLSEL